MRDLFNSWLYNFKLMGSDLFVPLCKVAVVLKIPDLVSLVGAYLNMGSFAVLAVFLSKILGAVYMSFKVYEQIEMRWIKKGSKEFLMYGVKSFPDFNLDKNSSNSNEISE